MKIIRLLQVASAAFFFALSSVALAQNAGTVTNHAFAIGKGAGVQGYTSLLCPSGQFPMGQTAADPQCVAISGDATITAAGVLTIGVNKVTLAKLATMAADTIIGNNTGSTATPAAVPLVDCSNALTYSTGTHTFGCNASAGTGTVTSVAGGGVTITSNGTIPPSYGLINHSLAVSASAGALTIALKDGAGNDPSSASPVTGNFRNATGTTGSWVQRSVTAANSLVISSGSTMGVTSSTAFRVWVVLFDDGGTMRLGAINCSADRRVFPLNETVPSSSTAEGGAGAADSVGVIYTGTAVTSKPFLIVGYVEWSASGVTAGTWTTTNVNFVQSFGPGVKKPGDVVQLSAATIASATSTTSSTFTATGLTASLAPASAANIIRVIATGPLTNSNGAATQAHIQIFRSTTAIGVANLNGATGTSAAAITAFDKPNTTGSTAYTVYLKSTDNVTNASFPFSVSTSGGTISLEEIMG